MKSFASKKGKRKKKSPCDGIKGDKVCPGEHSSSKKSIKQASHSKNAQTPEHTQKQGGYVGTKKRQSQHKRGQIIKIGETKEKQFHSSQSE